MVDRLGVRSELLEVSLQYSFFFLGQQQRPPMGLDDELITRFEQPSDIRHLDTAFLQWGIKELLPLAKYTRVKSCERHLIPAKCKTNTRVVYALPYKLSLAPKYSSNITCHVSPYHHVTGTCPVLA